MFDVLPTSSGQKSRSKSSLLISMLAHGLVGFLLIVLPLIFYQALPQAQTITILLPPSPKTPPPPIPSVPRTTSAPAREVQVTHSPLPLPQIPQETLPIPPAPEEYPTFSSALVGIPGGPLGAPSGPFEWTSLIPEASSDVRTPPPPLATPPKAPIPVGGRVQSAKLTHRVDPIYPELAKRARVQGIVLLQVIVSEDGTVDSIKVIRGHPLLTPAAVDAVQQWRYSPTLLNGDPMPVIATVTVNFILN